MSIAVSCVVPTRDRAALVGEAIASALGQGDEVALEVIVVDDGSRDDTAAVLARFGRDIRVIRTAGLGVAAARNAGLAAARGAFVAFLDSDDRWYAHKLALQLERMRREPALALAFTDYTLSERDGAGWKVVATRRHQGELTLTRLLERNFVGTLTVLARREMLTALGGFEPSLMRGSDYDLWLRVRRRHAIARVPEVLADYRWHAASLTGASRVRNRQNHIDVIERLAAVDPGMFQACGADAAEILARARERLAS
ncbi:MAG TPA: glycosyltransferase [Gaiellaceae bacterium]|nr:glycosyltransferase [Gaiellaceae bacterium]